jgi:hypothetical protein
MAFWLDYGTSCTSAVILLTLSKSYQLAMRRSTHCVTLYYLEDLYSIMHQPVIERLTTSLICIDWHVQTRRAMVQYVTCNPPPRLPALEIRPLMRSNSPTSLHYIDSPKTIAKSHCFLLNLCTYEATLFAPQSQP